MNDIIMKSWGLEPHINRLICHIIQFSNTVSLIHEFLMNVIGIFGIVYNTTKYPPIYKKKTSKSL